MLLLHKLAGFLQVCSEKYGNSTLNRNGEL